MFLRKSVVSKLGTSKYVDMAVAEKMVRVQTGFLVNASKDQHLCDPDSFHTHIGIHGLAMQRRSTVGWA